MKSGIQSFKVSVSLLLSFVTLGSLAAGPTTQPVTKPSTQPLSKISEADQIEFLQKNVQAQMQVKKRGHH